MTLKASFASVLRALRSKRNITQRDFADTTSRTYLSKLEAGKSSITLDKLDQVSRRLELSPITLLTLTLSEDTGKPPSELISKLQLEIADLQREDGLSGLRVLQEEGHQLRRLPRRARNDRESNRMQAELAFVD